MFEVKRRGQITYEDLLREMESMEHQLLIENSAMAMNLMVLEAKLRERFQAMDLQWQDKFGFDEDMLGDNPTVDEIRALIPRELPLLPSLAQVGPRRRHKRSLEAIGMGAAFALITALGVFGLASILQMALAWVA